MEKVQNLYKKYKVPVLYIFYGVITTLINILIYIFCYNILHLSNVLSTIIAWISSVLFAFVTNKIYVFESTSNQPNSLSYQIFAFFLCRTLTGLLDIGIMWISVDMLHYNALLMKIISNILVVVLNYIVSKVIIFKK